MLLLPTAASQREAVYGQRAELRRNLPDYRGLVKYIYAIIPPRRAHSLAEDITSLWRELARASDEPADLTSPAH